MEAQHEQVDKKEPGLVYCAKHQEPNLELKVGRKRFQVHNSITCESSVLAAVPPEDGVIWLDVMLTDNSLITEEAFENLLKVRFRDAEVAFLNTSLIEEQIEKTSVVGVCEVAFYLDFRTVLRNCRDFLEKERQRRARDRQGILERYGRKNRWRKEEEKVKGFMFCLL